MKEEKEEVGAGGNGRPTTQAAWWAGVSLGGEGRGGGGPRWECPTPRCAELSNCVRACREPELSDSKRTPVSQ